MSDPRKVHEQDQRTAAAEALASECGAFFKRLRACGVPPAAAQAMSEAYVAGIVDRESDPPEPWR